MSLSMKKYSVLLLLLLLLVSGWSNEPSGSSDSVSVDSLITAFNDAGLEAEGPSDLAQKEFGNTREEEKRILVPALGDDAGGRLFEFEETEDLEKAKAYYDELSAQGPLFFSHTYSKGNFLLQMNGDMEDSEFEKYKKVMDENIK